ncbi:MAG: ABC transporter ATP-binding protein [Betaproteobacteria bacterium]|nr:ABC transporter ATP-binding protein [Betaproteobacteria bacterium]
MASLALQAICKSFGETRVLDRLDLEVQDGEFLSLLGPSGCGKSTVLKLIAGLDHLDAGAIRLDGRDVARVAAKHRNVAMVFQSYALYPYMSAARNIATPLEMRRLSRWQRLPVIGRWLPGAASIHAGIDASVRRVAETVSLEQLLERKPGQLSGGQRQRVALARAMVRNPAIFLFDEPLSNLDTHLRKQVRTEIADLHRRLGTTFVYVTHDQEEAMAISDRVAVMEGGRILQLAAPETLYVRPDSVTVARFIGDPAINLIPAAADASGHVVADNTQIEFLVPGRSARALTLGFRPESLFPGARAGAMQLRMRLVSREYQGARCTLALETAGGSTVHAVLPAAESPAVKRGGDWQSWSIDRAQLLVFDSEGLRVDLASAVAGTISPSEEI